MNKKIIGFIIFFNLLNAKIYNIQTTNRLFKLPKKKYVIYALETSKDIYNKLGYRYPQNNCIIYNKYYLLCKYKKNENFHIIVNQINTKTYFIINKYIIHYLFSQKHFDNTANRKPKNANNNIPAVNLKDITHIDSYVLNDNFVVSKKLEKAEVNHVPELKEIETVNLNNIPQYDLKNNIKKINNNSNNNVNKKQETDIYSIFTFEKIFDFYQLKKIFKNIEYNQLLRKIKNEQKIIKNNIIDVFDLNFNNIYSKYNQNINNFVKTNIYPIFNYNIDNFIKIYQKNKSLYSTKLKNTLNYFNDTKYKLYINNIHLYNFKLKNVFNLNYDRNLIEYNVFFKIKKIFDIKQFKIVNNFRQKKKIKYTKQKYKFYKIINSNFIPKKKTNDDNSKSKLFDIIKNNFNQ